MGQMQRGIAEAVPCPWCGDQTDLSDHVDMLQDSLLAGQPAGYTCDGCRKPIRVKNIVTGTFVTVEGA